MTDLSELEKLARDFVETTPSGFVPSAQDDQPAPPSKQTGGGEVVVTGRMAQAGIKELRRQATVDVGYMDEPMMRAIILAALSANEVV